MIISEVINQMIKEIEKDHANESLDKANQNRAFSIEMYLDNLLECKKIDLVSFEGFIKQLAKASGLSKKVINGQLDIHADNRIREALEARRKAKEEAANAPESDYQIAVRTEAQQIIDSGTAYEYIYSVWQPRVKGNPLLGKACVVARGAQSCLNTKGIHVYANGESGDGKSYGISAHNNLLPPERLIDGDVSLKYLYYADSLMPATTLYIDDMNLNDGIATLHKKITTYFQKGAEYGTIIDGEAIQMQLPPRLSICTSSVDIHGDEQYRDRWLDVSINENQKKAIIEFQQHRDALSVRDDVDIFATDVCRFIYEDLADKRFFVEIPFAEEFEFPEKERPRGYDMFSDIIKSLTALRYKKRVTNEFGHLIAAPDDFFDAKEIYEGLHGHSDRKYTESERRFLQAMIDLHYVADVRQLAAKMKIGEPRVREIAKGRGNDEQKRHGLLSKCPALTVESVSVSSPDSSDREIHVTTKKFVYTLEDTFELMNDLETLIHIKKNSKTLSVNRRCSECSEDVAKMISNINNSRTEDVKDVDNIDIRPTSFLPPTPHKTFAEMGISFPPDKIDLKKTTTIDVPATADQSVAPIAFKCKCLNDVVKCLDKYATTIRTPVLGEHIDKFGTNYIKVRCRLEEHGWKYNAESRTLTRAQECM